MLVVEHLASVRSLFYEIKTLGNGNFAFFDRVIESSPDSSPGSSPGSIPGSNPDSSNSISQIISYYANNGHISDISEIYFYRPS